MLKQIANNFKAIEVFFEDNSDGSCTRMVLFEKDQKYILKQYNKTPLTEVEITMIQRMREGRFVIIKEIVIKQKRKYNKKRNNFA